MAIARILRTAWIIGTAALAAACASTPLPTGTLVLGEVMRVLTRQMVDANELAPHDEYPELARRLHDWGYTDAQIDAGRIIVERGLIYWNNTASGIKHSALLPALVPEGLSVEPGNVVEIEEGGRPVQTVRKVRARSLADGGCYYGDVPSGVANEVLGAIFLLGPRGSASLYCKGIEDEGWQRPRTYWHKLPGRQATAATATTTARPAAVSAAPLPASAPVAAADEPAVLTFYLSPQSPARPFFFPLPISIDGEQVAALDHGTCEVVLVPAGDHVVVAGGADAAVLRTHARRELVVSVAAGDKRVLEYSVDNQALIESEGMFTFFRRDEWAPRIYHFEQRDATPRDTCAIRHPPRDASRWRAGGPRAGAVSAQSHASGSLLVKAPG